MQEGASRRIARVNCGAVLSLGAQLVLVSAVIAGCGGAGELPLDEPEGAPVQYPDAVSPIVWRDVTDDVGVNFVHHVGPGDEYSMPAIMGGGGAVFDADGDGALDLYFVSGQRNALYLQDADGTFADATAVSGLGDTGYGMGAAVGDIDNDGDLDVFVSNYGRDVLFRNKGDGRFEDVSSAAGVANDAWSSSAAFLDFDGDGWLDLFVARYVRFNPDLVCQSDSGPRDFCGPAQFSGETDLLYRNLGNGRFEDVSRQAGITTLSDAGLGVVAADFDDDGRVDLYVANDADPNHLWLNQGDGTFLDDAMLVGLAFNRYGVGEAGMGVATGDADGDGDLDVFVTHLIEETNTYYENRGPAGFEDATASVGLALSSVPYTSFGVALFDYDNDGDLDLAIANGAVKRRAKTLSVGGGFFGAYAEPNQLFRNRGDGQFAEVSAGAEDFVAPPEVSRALLPADLDSDGDLDLVLVNIEGRARILRNDGPSAPGTRGNWAVLELVDPQYARSALGARAEVVVDGVSYIRHALPTGGYLSGAETSVHVGLGEATKVDAVRVVWPGGLIEEFAGFAAPARIALERGTGRTLEGGDALGD